MRSGGEGKSGGVRRGGGRSEGVTTERGVGRGVAEKEVRLTEREESKIRGEV